MASWKKLLTEGNVAASDVASGTLATARIPSLAASKITSGTLGTARIPSLAASKITSGTFSVDRIPDLNASKITAGTLPVARGGTGQTSGYNKSNWDTAYGWGDHSQAGYLTSQTDSQTLTFSGGTLSISGGNSVTIPDNNDNTQNTYSVSIPTSTTKLRLSGAGHDGNTTDDIEFVGSGATTVTRTTASKFTISSTNTTYSIQDGELSQNNFTNDDHTKLDGIAELANRYALSSASFNTTTGVLSIGGNASDSVTVDLDGRYLTSETDSQTLSISGQTLSISGGNSVTLPDSDAQTLSVSGTSLSISNGNSVTVPTGSWTLASATADNGNAILNGQKVIITGGTGITSTRSTKTITLALSSGAALANLGGGSGSNYLRQDGTWADPDTDTNTTYTLAAQDNSPAANIVFTPSSGSATTIELTDGDLAYAVSGNNITASIQSNVVGASELNVSGNGTSGQFLRTSGDGSFTWATPTDTNTTYSVATSSTAGLVKIGYTESGQNYPVELSSGKMFVNVPWTDNDTTYSVGDGGLTQKNFTTTLKTKLDGIATSADNYGNWTLNAGNINSVGSGKTVTLSGSGATSISQSVSSGNHTITISSTDTNTTYQAGTGLGLGGGYFYIADSGVSTVKIANSAVTTAKIMDDSVTNGKIADEAIDNNKLADNAVTSGAIASSAVTSAKIASSAVTSAKIASGAVTAAKLNSDPIYVLSYTLQAPVYTGRYYMPHASYGANYSIWSRYLTSIPTTVGGGTGTYNMPIIIPKAGRIVKWGFNGQGNSSTIGSCTWHLRYGTLSNGSTYSSTLATVGTDKTVSVTSSNRQYEWKNSGLSHTVAEDGVLVPLVRANPTSTKYIRGTFYIVIEYDI